MGESTVWISINYSVSKEKGGEFIPLLWHFLSALNGIFLFIEIFVFLDRKLDQVA